MDKPKILTDEEITQALKDLPGWSYENSRLTKQYQFEDFVGSLSFLNRMIAYFQEMDHHPDVHIFYNKVKFELIRYDVGEKVTDRDVMVAKEIEKTYATYSK